MVARPGEPRRPRPFTPDDVDLAEQTTADLVAVLEQRLALRLDAHSRNAMRMWVLQHLVHDDGTLLLATGDRVDAMFTTSCKTSVTASVA